MPPVFSGQVVGVSTYSTTPTAFCRAVTGGSLSINSNNVVNIGVQGQRQVLKGTQEIVLDVTCVGVDKTILPYWFPTGVGVQVAGFPAFFVEVDDGVNGANIILSGGQPSSITIACNGGANGVVEYQLQAKFTAMTSAAAGAPAAVYNSYVGHSVNHCTFSQGGNTFGVMSFTLSNDLGLELVNTMDGKAAGSQTFPTFYIPTGQRPTLSLVTTSQWALTQFGADAWNPLNYTLALANGIVGENITFTFPGWVPSSVSMPIEATGVIGFSHEFEPGPGTNYNRVQIA